MKLIMRLFQPRPSDGLRPMPDVPAGASEGEVFKLHLDHWIAEYYRGRVIVKRRAGGVLIVSTGITGVIAVLGGVMVLLAEGNVAVGILGIVTTGLSALSALLQAWNEHFHHRALWSARSVVLNRLEAIQLDYESTRESRKVDYAVLRRRLDEVLRDALKEWLRIQGNPSTE